MGEFFYNNYLIQQILYKRRKWRVGHLLSKVNLFTNMKILDVGCGPDGRSLENFLSVDYEIVGIDLFDENEVNILHPRFKYIKQDARNLSCFQNKEFDLALSIGMMEHVCTRSDLIKIAREIERVAKQYIIVVPWRYALIETHFKFPFFQLLPEKVKCFLIDKLNLHNLGDIIKIDPTYLRNNYQWLKNYEYRKIFLGSKTFISPMLDTIYIVKKCPVLSTLKQ